MIPILQLLNSCNSCNSFYRCTKRQSYVKKEKLFDEALAVFSAIGGCTRTRFNFCSGYCLQGAEGGGDTARREGLGSCGGDCRSVRKAATGPLASANRRSGSPGRRPGI